MNNLEIVKTLYEAFAARNSDLILEIFDPQIEWIQNEGFPGGGQYIGAELVLNNVFASFRTEWKEWKAIVDKWLDAGDAIIAIGKYYGTYKTTDKSMTAAFAHVYWIRDGRIIRFEQYTDTFKIAEAMQ